MAEDLFPEKGDDDLIWLTSIRFGTAVAVCREVDGQRYAAEDDSFYGEVGPFDSLEALADHVELNRLLALGEAQRIEFDRFLVGSLISVATRPSHDL